MRCAQWMMEANENEQWTLYVPNTVDADKELSCHLVPKPANIHTYFQPTFIHISGLKTSI